VQNAFHIHARRLTSTVDITSQKIKGTSHQDHEESQKINFAN